MFWKCKITLLSNNITREKVTQVDNPEFSCQVVKSPTTPPKYSHGTTQTRSKSFETCTDLKNKIELYSQSINFYCLSLLQQNIFFMYYCTAQSLKVKV